MTQVSGKNPYRPGVGVRPLYLAGREAPLRRFAAMLRAAPEQQASMRVTGLRGVGKSVLLEEFADHAQELDWEPALLELQPSHNTDEALTAVLGALLERTRQRLSRRERLRSAAGRALRAASLSFTWEDVSLGIASGHSVRKTSRATCSPRSSSPAPRAGPESSCCWTRLSWSATSATATASTHCRS